ncbi:MAG TPA: amidohydrolase family protein [Myxococcota bacterium]
MSVRRVLLVLLGVLLLAAVAVVWTILPPAPLDLPPRGALLANVTVINPGIGREAGRTLRITGDRIESIAAAAGGEGADARFSGAYLIPGLIDMHVHFPPDTGLRQTELFAFLFLDHGVTTVRDAGDVDGTSTAPARDGVRGGAFPGPRIFACGPLVDGPAPIWKGSLVVSEPGQATAAVAKIAEGKFDCVKVYDGLSTESLAALRKAAAEHGLPVIGHVPRQVPFEVAQLDDVQHLTGVATPPGGDTRPFPKNMVEWRNVDDARMDFIVETSKRLGIAHTPTLVTGERLRGMQDYAALRESPDAKLLPRFYRDVVWSPTEGLPVLRRLAPEDFPVLADAGERGMRLVQRLHAAGVPVFAGSDTQNPFVVPGASLLRELRLLEQAGLTPEQALAAATTLPGAFLRLPGLGRLEPGAPADLLVLRRDPTQSLDALDSLEAVIADGRLYTRAELDAQLARYREHAEGAVYDALSVVLVRRALARIFD